MKGKPVYDAAAKRPGRPAVDRRDEILDAAQRLYEAIGFEKTSIGDVARELGMSPANLYRSFPNRYAIDEAIVRRKLSAIEDAAWAAARIGGAPAAALRRLSLAVLSETRRLMFNQVRLHQICVVAARERWPVVVIHLDGLRGAVRHVIMEGQRCGAFRKANPEDLADAVSAALTTVWHPYMIEILADEDLEATCDQICELLVNGLAIG